MNNPNTMAARIFKAKYYSNGKFMDGAIRHNPSFSWRSIDNSRVLLKEGSRWRIRDGSLINVWKV